MHTSNISKQKLPVIIDLFAKQHEKAHGKKDKMPVTNIYLS